MNSRNEFDPLKENVMLRVCITIIAYIISFLSHSGELPEAQEQEGARQGATGLEQMATVDSLMIRREIDNEILW